MNYYDFAKQDLISAETLYKYTEEYDVIVFHCQQYLEKSLKHLLELKCKEISKSHKLTVILQKLCITELQDFMSVFREIQDYYFDKRYPGDNYIVTSKVECDYLYNFTKNLRPILESLIQKYSVSYENSNLKKTSIFDNVTR